MQKKIIILGTVGNCIDILETIKAINELNKKKIYECVGFLDDNEQNWGKEYYGISVLGPLSSASNYSDHLFINGIGSPFNFWLKKAIIAQTNIPDCRFETIIHPSASVSPTAKLGYGSVIFQNVTVASNVKIGNHVIVLSNSAINHDTVIGDYTCIASGVCCSGGVIVGRSCYLGTNSAIIGNVKIGNYCLIGMGSVILKDIDDNQVVVGNPAMFIRNTISENQYMET